MRKALEGAGKGPDRVKEVLERVKKVRDMQKVLRNRIGTTRAEERAN